MSAITSYAMQAKYTLMPNTQSVTFSQQTAVGVYSDTAIGTAWYRDLNDKEKATSRGVYVEHERNWFIPKLLYPTQPMPGDVVTDGDGNEYTALSMGEVGGLGTWKVRSVNLVIAANLRQLVSIYKPTNTQDTSGNRVPTYAAQYTALAGRIQPLGGDRTDVQGKLGILPSFACYLATQVVVTTEYQVRCDGVNYQVRAFSNPERIDELMQLTLEVLL